MKEFKFSSEFSINMFLSSYQFLQQTELETFGRVQQTFTDQNPCNIYFILKRHRLSLDPDYLKVDKGLLELRYFIHIKEEKHERYLKIQIPQELDNIKIKSEYPYSYFSLTDDDLFNAQMKLAVIVDEYHKMAGKPEPLLDYEVLYIGQAFGEDGKRTAIDRLGTHSTLQKIYSEAMSRNPDSEIWLMLCAFTERKIGSMNGKIKIPKENEREDLDRFVDFMKPNESSFSDKVKVNFTEAALIKAFFPTYNKDYKDTFPSPAHSSYEDCYKQDVNGIVVEMDLSEARRWIYSEALPRRKAGETGFPFWQKGMFHFVNDKDRYKMFNHDYL